MPKYDLCLLVYMSSNLHIMLLKLLLISIEHGKVESQAIRQYIGVYRYFKKPCDKEGGG